MDAKDKQDLRVVLVDEVRDAVYEQLYEYPLYNESDADRWSKAEDTYTFDSGWW